MSIKCGNCQGYHETVNLVKMCCGTPVKVAEFTLADYLGMNPRFCVDCGIIFSMHGREHQEPPTHERACEKPQYELNLVPEMPGDELFSGTLAEWATLYMQYKVEQTKLQDDLRASQEWEQQNYRSQPFRQARAGGGYAELEELRQRVRSLFDKWETDRMRFALVHAEEVKFYQLDVPEQGKWKGYVFLKIQASDDVWPVKAIASQRAVIQAFLLNPEEAIALYGKEIGSCGHCHRTLTNEESRKRGIGPICAGKMGF